MGLLKLLRSLEGGTRVQQIIIGYFVAPISTDKNNKIKNLQKM
jgi:hypothetical protein